MTSIVRGITGGKTSEQKRAEREAAESRRRANEAQAQQEAVQKRLTLKEGEREQELERQQASQRRAVAARRSGRSGLKFKGPVGLKDTLGG